MVGVAWVANDIRRDRSEVRGYREERSEANIIGRTADQIVATYGKPYHVERGTDGQPIFIMYKQVKHGQYCGIMLKDGVAVRVSFSFQ
ncbi:MAG: hypothetical protein M3478_04700 [Planctomycetota bacterium]|nr:hypothetical protein [Planctomycetota bacterium]